jgi:serine/threonine protein kinase
MGTVYLAHDTVLDRRVALKVPRFDPGDAEAAARFLREARAAATLDHPGLCPVHDADEADGRLFLTMAHVEGEPLSELLRAGPLPSERAVALVRQIASAMQHAHGRGVVHRDPSRPMSCSTATAGPWSWTSGLHAAPPPGRTLTQARPDPRHAGVHGPGAGQR